jgi:dTDP-4-dehydrorhamnose reductase
MLRGDFDGYGIYHLAGTGETNWSGFARHIMATSRRVGGPYAAVRDIASRGYPTKARRPANSRLSTQKFTAAFGWVALEWRQSTELVVRRVLRSSVNA